MTRKDAQKRSGFCLASFGTYTARMDVLGTLLEITA